MTTRAGPYYCRICDVEIAEIPADAVLVTTGGYYKLYRFPDGRLHDVREVKKHTAQSAGEKYMLNRLERQQIFSELISGRTPFGTPEFEEGVRQLVRSEMPLEYLGVEANESPGFRAYLTEWSRGRDARQDAVRLLQALPNCIARAQSMFCPHPALEEFFKAHPELRGMRSANFRTMVDAYKSAIEDGVFLDDTITYAGLEQVLQDPDVANRLLLTPAAQAQIQNDAELQALRAELLNVKQFRDDQTGRMACFDENGRRVFFENYTLGLNNGGAVPVVGYRERIESAGLEELRAIRDRRTAQRSLQTQTVDQLREVVKKDADANRQALVDSRYAPIPSRYVPPSKSDECGVRWSKQLLYKLPATEVKRLLARYGQQALNAACGIG